MSSSVLVPKPPFASKSANRPRKQSKITFDFGETITIDPNPRSSILKSSAEIPKTTNGRASTDILAEYTGFGTDVDTAAEADANLSAPFFRNSVNDTPFPGSGKSPATSPRRGQSLSPRSIGSSRPNTSKPSIGRLTVDVNQSNAYNEWAAPLSAPSASPPRRLHQKFSMATFSDPKANYFFDPTPYIMAQHQTSRPRTAPTTSTNRDSWKSILTHSNVPKYNAITDPNCRYVHSPRFLNSVKQTCSLSPQEEMTLSQRIQVRAIQEQTMQLTQQKLGQSSISPRSTQLYSPSMASNPSPASRPSTSPRKTSFAAYGAVPSDRPLSSSARDKMALLRNRKARTSSVEHQPTPPSAITTPRGESAPSGQQRQRPAMRQPSAPPSSRFAADATRRSHFKDSNPPTERPSFASPRARQQTSRRSQTATSSSSANIHSDTTSQRSSTEAPTTSAYTTSTATDTEGGGGALSSEFERARPMLCQRPEIPPPISSNTELPSTSSYSASSPSPPPPTSARRTVPTTNSKNGNSTSATSDESEEKPPSTSSTSTSTVVHTNTSAFEGFEAIEVPIVSDDMWDRRSQDSESQSDEDDRSSQTPASSKAQTTATSSSQSDLTSTTHNEQKARTVMARQPQPPPRSYAKDRSPPTTASSSSRPSTAGSVSSHKPETPRMPSRERDGSRGGHRMSITRSIASEPVVDLSKCFDWAHQELPLPPLPEGIAKMPPKEALQILWPLLHCPHSVSEAFTREHLKGMSPRSQMIALSEVNNLLSLYERVIELLKHIHRREELVKGGFSHSSHRVEFLTVSQNIITVLQRLKMDVPWMFPFVFNGVDYLSKTHEYTRSVLAE